MHRHVRGTATTDILLPPKEEHVTGPLGPTQSKCGVSSNQRITATNSICSTGCRLNSTIYSTSNKSTKLLLDTVPGNATKYRRRARAAEPTELGCYRQECQH